MMETVEITGAERPLIRGVVERERARYNRRRWPEAVLSDPDQAAEIATGEIARESLALQVAEGEGALTLEGDAGVLSECLGELIAELADDLDPVGEGLDNAERGALRIATLAAEVRRLDAVDRGRVN